MDQDGGLRPFCTGVGASAEFASGIIASILVSGVEIAHGLVFFFSCKISEMNGAEASARCRCDQSIAVLSTQAPKLSVSYRCVVPWALCAWSTWRYRYRTALPSGTDADRLSMATERRKLSSVSPLYLPRRAGRTERPPGFWLVESHGKVCRARWLRAALPIEHNRGLGFCQCTVLPPFVITTAITRTTQQHGRSGGSSLPGTVS
nr:hypothetical protein CFP56_71109 [Quercus suber]